jgi:hypothetical protein
MREPQVAGRRYLQEIIGNLREYYKCPSCSTNYHLDDIKFLGQIDVYCFVQLTCHACSLPVVATVSVGEDKPKSTGRKRAKTDLKRTENAKFTKLGPITAGEIAGFHSYLQSHHGGFSSLK